MFNVGSAFFSTPETFASSLLTGVYGSAQTGIGVPPPVGDESYANVSLLLHGDDVNGTQILIDSSISPWIMDYVAGGVYVSNEQNKFGGTSIKINGAYAGFTIPASSKFAYGTGDFTWEMWVYPDFFNDNTYILDHGSNNGSIRYLSGQVLYYNNGTMVSGGSLSFGQWSHLAVTRASGTTRIFVNGVLVGSVADTVDMPALAVRIGTASITGFYGYLDEVRITKGVARYVSNFTVPSTAFPNF